MQRYTDVGLTNVLTGAFVDNVATLDTNLQDVIFASFAYAGFFPPAESMGNTWFDGSVIWDLDIFSAVNKCLETHAQADIVVDVLLSSEKTLKTVDASNYNSVQMGIRFLEVSRYYGAMDGLLRAQFAYPEVQFRHVISPSGELSSSHLPLVSFNYRCQLMMLFYIEFGHGSSKCRYRHGCTRWSSSQRARDPRLVAFLLFEEEARPTRSWNQIRRVFEHERGRRFRAIIQY